MPGIAGLPDVDGRRSVGLDRLLVLQLGDVVHTARSDQLAPDDRGELGEDGCAAFLSALGLQKLPCILETPGENRSGPSREEVTYATRLRERGLAARKRS